MQFTKEDKILIKNLLVVWHFLHESALSNSSVMLCNEVVIDVGFVLSLQLAVHGSYSLSQLCIKRGNIEFLKSLASVSVILSVQGTDFSVDLTPVHCTYTSWLSLLDLQ